MGNSENKFNNVINNSKALSEQEIFSKIEKATHTTEEIKVLFAEKMDELTVELSDCKIQNYQVAKDLDNLKNANTILNKQISELIEFKKETATTLKALGVEVINCKSLLQFRANEKVVAHEVASIKEKAVPADSKKKN